MDQEAMNDDDVQSGAAHWRSGSSSNAYGFPGPASFANEASETNAPRTQYTRPIEIIPIEQPAPLEIRKEKLDNDRRVRWENKHERDFEWDDLMASDGEEEEDEEEENEEEEDEDEEGREMNHEEGEGRFIPSRKERRLRRTAREVSKFREGKTEEDILFQRRKYWRDVDLKCKWCVLCRYQQNMTDSDQKRLPFVQRMMSFIETKIGRMCPITLCHLVQDLFLARIRPRLAARGIDVYTGLPKPPHWFHLTVIWSHIFEHEANPRVEIERTYRSMITIQQDLENSIRKKQDNDDKNFRYDISTTKLYLELLKHKSIIEKQVVLNRSAAK